MVVPHNRTELVMTTEAQRKDAYKLLNEAVDALVGPVSPGMQIATDAVLVVGCQGITNGGHRIGSAGVFVKDGSQPMWITRSLLREALLALDNMHAHCASCSCDE